MKNWLFILGIFAIGLATSCNSNQKDESGHDHETMNMHTDTIKNVMMDAMNVSMDSMMSAKPTENIDYDFANRMKPHHDGAVVMAEELLKTTKDKELIDFCNHIISAQNKEIDAFNEFLKEIPKTKHKDYEAYDKADKAAMMVMMNGMDTLKLTHNMDIDFVALMIPHHQSAVDMAKAYLPYAQDAKLKVIAEDIIKSQTEEIEWLKTKL